LKKPKQADVARLAGVSQATVSQVLNNTSSFSVPIETRQRIQDAVKRIGYVPNDLARSLRTRRTQTLASVIPDISNPFYPALERGIQNVADAHGFDLIVYNTDGALEKEKRCLQSLLRGRVDGVIGVFFHLGPQDLRVLSEHNLAVVVLYEAELEPNSSFDRVFVDNVKAARAGVEHLLERGHRRICMLSGPHGTLTNRVEGYLQALRAHSPALEPHIVEAQDFTEACGYTAMQEVLAGAERFSAVFAANDLMAMGALSALREAGLKVPQDVALMGFDDIPASRLLTPALSTVTQFQEGMGRQAAQLLLERLSGSVTAAGRAVEMPFEVVVRDST